MDRTDHIMPPGVAYMLLLKLSTTCTYAIPKEEANTLDSSQEVQIV
jgi:hypothetical protein